MHDIVPVNSVQCTFVKAVVAKASLATIADRTKSYTSATREEPTPRRRFSSFSLQWLLHLTMSVMSI